MDISQDFQDRLALRFDSRYRLRWSDAESNYHLEQRVARAKAEGMVNLGSKNALDRKMNYEDRVRARDGFVLTAKIMPGTKAPCVVCGTEMPIEPFKFVSKRCEHCAWMGRDVNVVAGYFPIGDTLLDHLDKIDAYKGGNDRVSKSVASKMFRKEIADEMDLYNYMRDATNDRWRRLAGNPALGYTGKIFTGSEGPGTR